MNQEHFSIVQGELARKVQIPAREERLTTEQLLELSRITPTTELPPMENLFRMYDVPCFYRGELVGCCGKAKSGKTMLLSIIMAACLSSKTLALERVSDENLRVLWIDTEQSQQSTQDILVNRVMPLAGVSELSDDQFFAFNLRGLGYEKRMELTRKAIGTVSPDLVIIDGIKDLVTDINDAVQATLIMEQLMALAQQNNCCIVNVLHQNKSEADHNMRGSIGTELTNKAFEVFQCELIEECETFKVKQTFSRKDRIKHKLFYRLNEQALPEECSDVQEQPRDEQGRWISSKTAGKEAETVVVDLRNFFTKAMEGRTSRPFTEVMGIAMKKCGIANSKTYYAYINLAEEQGIVRKVVHPETHATWLELIEDEVPF